MSKILKVISFPFVKIYNLTKGVNDAIQAPTIIGNKINEGFTLATKVTGATTGSLGAAKGTVDALEALACQDGVCFVVSCVGTMADGLQILASFVPGPNVTVVITTPVSAFCKMFVWCCKRSKLPWKGGC
jgi:hypothetical protein